MIELEQVFLKVVNMSITAGYCIMVVLLLRFFIRKLPKIYSYALWTAVYFRLICPVSLESTLSLIRMRTEPIPQDTDTQILSHISVGTIPAGQAVKHTVQGNALQTEIADSVNLMRILLAAAGILWITACCLLLICSTWSYIRLRIRLRNAVLLEEGVYEKEGIETPFVIGLCRPKIFLPPGMEERDQGFVLEHERTHIRRRDHLVKQAAFLISCVHWFHPLVWLSFYLMCRDMEMSCDEAVIRKLGREVRREYSAALLSLSSGRKIVLGSPLAFGENSIRSRIVNVLQYRKRAVWVSLAAAAGIAAVTAGLALNPEDDKARTENSKEDVNDTAADGEGHAGQDAETVSEGNILPNYMDYEGYLDEAPGESKHTYQKLDLDQDGTLDRVFRYREGDTASFEIRFGNGEELLLGEFEKSYVFPKISAARIETVKAPVILFTCVDIMDNIEKETKLALYTKLGKQFAKIVLQPDADDGPYLDGKEMRAGYFFTETYDAERNKMQVTFRDTDQILEFTPEEVVAADFSWQNDCAYSAQLSTYQGESCVVFCERAYGKGPWADFCYVLAIRPSERSDWNPYHLDLVYAGWTDELGKDGFDLPD